MADLSGEFLLLPRFLSRHATLTARLIYIAGRKKTAERDVERLYVRFYGSS
jgi:hypothetical protein